MNDPRNYLDKEKMGRLQIIVVLITTLLNAIDGFDVLSISFAAPGIAKEWGTTQAALGVVMSMELIRNGLPRSLPIWVLLLPLLEVFWFGRIWEALSEEQYSAG
jgi:hypothetical protein